MEDEKGAKASTTGGLRIAERVLRRRLRLKAFAQGRTPLDLGQMSYPEFNLNAHTCQP